MCYRLADNGLGSIFLISGFLGVSLSYKTINIQIHPILWLMEPRDSSRIYKGCPITAFLCRINPIHRIDIYFFKINVNVVLLPRSTFQILKALLASSIQATSAPRLNQRKRKKFSLGPGFELGSPTLRAGELPTGPPRPITGAGPVLMSSPLRTLMPVRRVVGIK